METKALSAATSEAGKEEDCGNTSLLLSGSSQSAVKRNQNNTRNVNSTHPMKALQAVDLQVMCAISIFLGLSNAFFCCGVKS